MSLSSTGLSKSASLAVRTTLAPAAPEAASFDIACLQIFSEIPAFHHDVVALSGMVAVYDYECLGREGIEEGGFYVRESQHTPAAMSWDRWLTAELQDRTPRCQPRSPLKVRREVVRAFRCPQTGNWALQLASGFIDGPYHDWSFGTDLIGKVVGIYLPGKEA
jgi:hypothetical protein